MKMTTSSMVNKDLIVHRARHQKQHAMFAHVRKYVAVRQSLAIGEVGDSGWMYNTCDYEETGSLLHPCNVLGEIPDYISQQAEHNTPGLGPYKGSYPDQGHGY